MLDLENCFHFDGSTSGECGKAERTAGMIAIPILAENLVEKVGRPVDHEVLVGKCSRRIDTPQHFNDFQPIQRAIGLTERTENLHRTFFRGGVALFDGQSGSQDALGIAHMAAAHVQIARADTEIEITLGLFGKGNTELDGALLRRHEWEKVKGGREQPVASFLDKGRGSCRKLYSWAWRLSSRGGEGRMSLMSNRPARLTVPEFVALKRSGRKISMLTAYDYPTAALLDGAGIEAILVGDSMSMVVQGHETTLPVTLDEIIYHAEMVGRAVQNALVIVDMPFPTNHLGIHKAIENAGRILKETRCQAVKLEGGADQADVISALVAAGIPVMAHVGLRPQSVHTMGGYKVQRDAEKLMADARAAQDAGAFGIVLECIPTSIATQITQSLDIPTIGIGAGAGCDGQVLVLHDLIGLTAGYVPKFVKPYADLKSIITGAATKYRDEVRSGEFPGKGNEFK